MCGWDYLIFHVLASGVLRKRAGPDQVPQVCLADTLWVREANSTNLEFSFKSVHLALLSKTTDIHPDVVRRRNSPANDSSSSQVMEDDDVAWEVNVGYNSCSYGIPACVTFTPKKKYKKGLHSLVVFEIDTRRTNNVLLFFHEARKTFVVEDIFGTDVLQLPKVPDNSAEPTTIKMVKITPTRQEKLSKVAFEHGL